MSHPATARTVDTTPDVSNLSAACTDVKSIDFDCTEGYGDTWGYTEATECSECGAKLIADNGEQQHQDLDASTVCEGYVSSEGPMFNYLYPLDKVPSDEEIREALSDLPLCIVTMTNAWDRGTAAHEAYLALTGGGMNMAWYICTAYVRLGCLPPLTYCCLPNFAGMTLTDERRLVLAACKETARIEMRSAEAVAEDLATLESNLRARRAA